MAISNTYSCGPLAGTINASISLTSQPGRPFTVPCETSTNAYEEGIFRRTRGRRHQGTKVNPSVVLRISVFLRTRLNLSLMYNVLILWYFLGLSGCVAFGLSGKQGVTFEHDYSFDSLQLISMEVSLIKCKVVIVFEITTCCFSMIWNYFSFDEHVSQPQKQIISNQKAICDRDVIDCLPTVNNQSIKFADFSLQAGNMFHVA